jgi:hypothetical protein
MTEPTLDATSVATSISFSDLAKDFASLTFVEFDASLKGQTRRFKPEMLARSRKVSSRGISGTAFYRSISKVTQGQMAPSSTDTDDFSGVPGETGCSLDYTGLKEGVYRIVGMTANEMRCKGPDLYEYDRDHLKPLWRLLLDGVLICNDALRCEVLYTAIASHDDPPMEEAVEKAVETWSRQISYIWNRAYWDIDLPDEKTGKEIREGQEDVCNRGPGNH